MFYLARRFPLVGKQQANAELRRLRDYGASIHRRGDSHYWDLLIALDQRKPERLARWYDRTFPGLLHLVNVQTFDPDAGVIFEHVTGADKTPEPVAHDG